MEGRLSRFRVLPTRRLALLVLLAAPLWLFSESTAGSIVVIAGVMAIATAVIVEVVLFPRRDALHIERSLPSAAGIGDEVDGAYGLHSSWGTPIRATLYDALPRGVDTVLGAPAAVEVPARGRVIVPVRVRGRERGSWPVGPVALRVRGPLGLLQRTVRVPLADVITVTPSLSGVRRFRLLSLQHRLRDAGIRTVRRRGEGTTFAGLREYARGDDPRRIDWKATARRGKLIAREYALEQGQTIMLLVDAGRMMTQLAGELPRFEYALSSALVLADVAIHAGDQVGLMLFDDVVRAFVPPVRGRPALQQLREALIPARASMVEPDYAAAFRTLAARHRRRSLLVMFTDVIDARASNALIAHTMRSAARHLTLVVALRNDALVAAANPAERESTAGLYETAAAEELLASRAEALLTMRRAGVWVVDVSPQVMTAAVVNRYLELKGRASL